MTRTALVLAGHGSHISPETAGLVWGHVDALRAANAADEITAAFWKEQPSFHAVFNALEADDVAVVPLFTAQGYFTQTVIPAEMGLDGPATWRAGKLIRYARTLSEHSYLADVVRRRVEDAIRQLGSDPARTAVAVIGHSTRRNPESRKATEAQAELIRQSGLAAEVVAVYLDDSPGVADAYRLTRAPDLIAVPYFLALGSHTSIDVPRRLGVDAVGQPQAVNGRRVFYTPPVGIEDSLRQVVLQLARDAGAPLEIGFDGSQWDAFPSAGRDALIAAVTETGGLRFGELWLTPDEARRWDDGAAAQTLDSPAALRARVRERPFRSLATAIGLPGGWRVRVDRPEKLHAVVETVYPGAVANWAAARRGTFQPGSFERTLSRQTGDYRKLANWDAARQARVVERVCGRCVLEPTWFDTPGPYTVSLCSTTADELGGTTPVRTVPPNSKNAWPAPPSGRGEKNGDATAETIPCPEPCNHWLSAALGAINEGQNDE